MRNVIILLLMVSCVGCQSARTAAHKGGQGVGEVVGVGDSFTQGIAEGYASTDNSKDNPYQR